MVKKFSYYGARGQTTNRIFIKFTRLSKLPFHQTQPLLQISTLVVTGRLSCSVFQSRVYGILIYIYRQTKPQIDLKLASSLAIPKVLYNYEAQQLNYFRTFFVIGLQSWNFRFIPLLFYTEIINKTLLEWAADQKSWFSSVKK